MSEEKKLRVRNSTAEFLIFTGQTGEDAIEVRVAEETVWLTQKLMGVLFEVTVPTINEHLSKLYVQGEISRTATIRNFRTVQKEGLREITRNMEEKDWPIRISCVWVFALKNHRLIEENLHDHQGY